MKEEIKNQRKVKKMEKIGVINKEEMGEKGEEIYENIKAKLELKCKGEFVAIDIDSGDYFLGKTLREADEKARDKYPNKVFYVVRIGRRAVWIKR